MVTWRLAPGSDPSRPSPYISPRIGRGRIIRNRKVLTDSYLPPHLPGRDFQITTFDEYLEPLLYDEQPFDLAFTGKTGTGKTAVARHVLVRKMEELAGAPVKFLYLNCSQANTAYRVMYHLNRAFGILVPPSGYPFDVLFNNFKSVFEGGRLRVVLVLDELDLLVKRDGGRLLYGLTRLNGDLIERSSSLTIVGIANTPDFLERLEERTRSSFKPKRIYFPPYGAGELLDILRERAKLGLVEGTWSEEALSHIAAAVARESGDARRAIDLLRLAAELAEKDGSSARLEVRHAEAALDYVDEGEIEIVIRTLPFHHRLVLQAAAELLHRGDPRPGTGAVYSRYSALARRWQMRPLTLRRVSGILRELESQGVISLEMSYGGARGNTKVVTGMALRPDRMLAKLSKLGVR